MYTPFCLLESVRGVLPLGRRLLTFLRLEMIYMFYPENEIRQLFLEMIVHLN
jgi:hypothetical protein